MFATSTILVVNAAKPWKTVQAFVEAARVKPGALTYGSAGSGTGTHLTSELFQGAAGIKMVHVPYKGSAPALNDLLGGTVDAMFDYPVTLLPHIKSGKLRALLVTGAGRLEALPDVPTVVEAGYPGARSESWSGVFVSAHTPDAVVQKLAAAVQAALRDPAVSQPIEANGSTSMLELAGPKFGKFVADEGVKWADVVKRSGASAD